ncbi:hypothetical protein CPB86DRAFT_787101 [Serendipita vermifera]|nr:hypothetical protein CPB86DRAFT_787101 [Serendipita vermifera]
MTQNANTNAFPPVVPVNSPPPAYSPVDPSPTRQGFNPFAQEQYAIEAEPVASFSQGAYLDRRATAQPSISTTLGSPPHQRYASVHGYPQSQQNMNPYAQPSSPVARNNTVSTHRSGAYASSSPISPTSLSAGNRNSALPAAPNARASVNRRASVEDPLLQLVKYDTIIIVDDSSSMAGARWFEAREALAGVAELASKYDSDGIDIHFLNSTLVGQGLTNAAEVNSLFNRVEPDGITPTGEKLEELLLDYLLKLEDAYAQAAAGDPTAKNAVKPANFLVITDGAPTDDPETVIVQAARRLDAGKFPLNQVGIQFIQIGNDPSATEALQELDDDLAARHGIRDIVDTTPYSGSELDATALTKILLGGINRRVDRRGAS